MSSKLTDAERVKMRTVLQEITREQRSNQILAEVRSEDAARKKAAIHRALEQVDRLREEETEEQKAYDAYARQLDERVKSAIAAMDTAGFRTTTAPRARAKEWTLLMVAKGETEGLPKEWLQQWVKCDAECPVCYHPCCDRDVDHNRALRQMEMATKTRLHAIKDMPYRHSKKLEAERINEEVQHHLRGARFALEKTNAEIARHDRKHKAIVAGKKERRDKDAAAAPGRSIRKKKR